jgi:hypothetical protein
MSISASTLTKNEYENFRYELIILVEEGGHENLDLYTDNAGHGRS